MLKKLLTPRNLIIATTLVVAMFLRSSPTTAAKAQNLLATLGSTFSTDSSATQTQPADQVSAPQHQTTSQPNDQSTSKSATKPAPKITTGQQIASGHAFPKHKAEFGFTTQQHMASYIDQAIKSAAPSNIRKLSRGRVAYWDPQKKAVIIVDPNTHDGGTCFKPRRGRDYFKGLN